MINFSKTAKTFVVSTFAISAVMIGSANADDEVTFTYNQYELETNKGIARVFNRLERNVKNMCTESRRQTLANIQYSRECRANLMENFVSKIDHPGIYTLYDSSMAQVRVAQK